MAENEKQFLDRKYFLRGKEIKYEDARFQLVITKNELELPKKSFKLKLNLEAIQF